LQKFTFSWDAVQGKTVLRLFVASFVFCLSALLFIVIKHDTIFAKMPGRVYLTLSLNKYHHFIMCPEQPDK